MEVEPAEQVPLNIYQSGACRKDLSWQNYDDEPRVQERQQKKDQKTYITCFCGLSYISN